MVFIQGLLTSTQENAVYQKMNNLICQYLYLNICAKNMLLHTLLGRVASFNLIKWVRLSITCKIEKRENVTIILPNDTRIFLYFVFFVCFFTGMLTSSGYVIEKKRELSCPRVCFSIFIQIFRFASQGHLQDIFFFSSIHKGLFPIFSEI